MNGANHLAASTRCGRVGSPLPAIVFRQIGYRPFVQPLYNISLVSVAWWPGRHNATKPPSAHSCRLMSIALMSLYDSCLRVLITSTGFSKPLTIAVEPPPAATSSRNVVSIFYALRTLILQYCTYSSVFSTVCTRCAVRRLGYLERYIHVRCAVGTVLHTYRRSQAY